MAKTFKELFAGTGIEPTTDKDGGVHYNFNATLKNQEDKPFVEEKETYLMDTPIQELIDWVETRDMSNYQNKYAFKQAIIAKLKQTIEKEKREIIDAFEHGICDEEPLSGLAYYNEKFENK